MSELEMFFNGFRPGSVRFKCFDWSAFARPLLWQHTTCPNTLLRHQRAFPSTILWHQRVCSLSKKLLYYYTISASITSVHLHMRYANSLMYINFHVLDGNVVGLLTVASPVQVYIHFSPFSINNKIVYSFRGRNLDPYFL